MTTSLEKLTVLILASMLFCLLFMGCSIESQYDATEQQLIEGMETCRELGIHMKELRKLTEKECLGLTKTITKCDNCLFDHYGKHFNNFRDNDTLCKIECRGIK